MTKRDKAAFHDSENTLGLSFHHLGLAVPRPDEASRFLSSLGYSVGETVYDPVQNVNLALCFHDTMPTVEVIFPGIGVGPLDKLFCAQRDGLVYHLCFVTQDLDMTLEAVEEASNVKVFCVSDPKPAVVFGGRNVSFYLLTNIGLIEIIENAVPNQLLSD